MMPTFPYVAMSITGALHIFLGFIIFINTCIGLNMKAVWVYGYRFEQHTLVHVQSIIRIYLGFVIASSLWIIMVGLLGIVAGLKRLEHRRTHGLKIGYMVTAILSATIFSLAGLSLSALVSPTYSTIGLVGSIASFADFVLAIVSASICCCCANSTSSTTGVVFIQNQATPGTYPPGTYPPGTYPPGTYPPGTYPPSYPVQTYPVSQSPQEGVVNPGYQLNPIPTKNEVA